MTIILSDISALQCYRSCAFDDAASSTRKPLRRQQAQRMLQSVDARALSVAAAAEASIDKPLHVLVPNEQARSRSRQLACHIAPSHLPSQAFLPVSKSVLAPSPALLIELLAPSLPLVQLIALCWELSGDYRLGTFPDRTFRPRPSFDDPDVLAESLRGHSENRGVHKATTALKHTCAHSASPMETIVGIQLSLPCCYGGFGLPKPQMNHRIELTSNAKRTSGKSFLVADLFWPEHNLCVEYQSTQFHTGADRIDSDARRRTALDGLGFTVIEVTSSQALDQSAMRDVADAIARKMHRRIRPTDKWKAKHECMRSQLLSWHGFSS